MTLTAILDECLQELQRGIPVEDCLAGHPDKAASLAPMLSTAARLPAMD